MEGEALAIVERLFKGLFLASSLGVVAWLLFTSWMERVLNLGEFCIGLALLTGAFLLGVLTILRGGWGFLGVIGMVIAALLGLAVWDYIFWKKHERQCLLDRIERGRELIDIDPKNAVAYSIMGKSLLQMERYDEAVAALEKAVELDPESRKDARLLEHARKRKFPDSP